MEETGGVQYWYVIGKGCLRYEYRTGAGWAQFLMTISLLLFFFQ